MLAMSGTWIFHREFRNFSLPMHPSVFVYAAECTYATPALAEASETRVDM